MGGKQDHGGAGEMWRCGGHGRQYPNFVKLLQCGCGAPKPNWGEMLFCFEFVYVFKNHVENVKFSAGAMFSNNCCEIVFL